MAATTSTTLDDLFVNIVAQARFTAEEQSLMMGLVTQYNIQAQAGKTIQVPKYPAIAAANLTEGTDMTSTTVSTSSVSVTGAVCALTNDVTAKIAIVNVKMYFFIIIVLLCLFQI